MKKQNPRRQQPKTEFEQIPVATVKRVLNRRESSEKPSRARNVIVEPTASKTEPYSTMTGLLSHLYV